jgi:hypothetical protein
MNVQISSSETYSLRTATWKETTQDLLITAYNPIGQSAFDEDVQADSASSQRPEESPRHFSSGLARKAARRLSTVRRAQSRAQSDSVR